MSAPQICPAPGSSLSITYFGILSSFGVSEIFYKTNVRSISLHFSNCNCFFGDKYNSINILFGLGGNAAPGAIPDCFELFGERSGNGVV